ncbi:phage protein [Streptococcus pneumoniae]|nr:phage protein [Streptococcus pneumoniae]VJV52398.1 phage protein [Streptococcus pneumoniae]VJV57317.1 phage protein [Streptococcus pneumoniae]VJY23086.1 phage protein [Streptococcus pneumoniae]VKF56644.1 phage protein [Streptococcus pneumoniae]
MNKQELINVPRILFPIGTEILIKGKIVGLKVLADRFVENIVKLDYGEQIIAPNDAIYVKDEPQPVKVPQFVAEFITEQKKLGHTLSYSIDASMSDIVAEWYWDNSELFALAWIFGYEVEKEKRYFVKIKGNIKENMLVYGELLKRYFFTKSFSLDDVIYSHTRKELEEAGFGWVFDCPGIEIEEVEYDTNA